jgi:predicted MFS family arabinose efflux permease
LTEPTSSAVCANVDGSTAPTLVNRLLRNRWFMLATLFTARAAMGFQFQSIGASASSLAAQLSLDSTEIGALIGLYMLPGVAIALPGGLLSRRFGEKSTCLLGLALMIVGAIIAAASDVRYGVAVGRMISGSGAVIFNLVLTSMVVGWFAGRELVTALALILACWPLSIGAALIGETALSLVYGWRAVMNCTAILSGIAFLLVALLYRPPAPSLVVAPPTGDGAALSPPAAAACGVAGLLWGVFNGGLVVFYSFTPLLLTEHSWQPLDAGSTTSLALWISVTSLPLGGWLAEISKRLTMVIVSSCIVAGLAMLVLTTMALPWGLSALVGLAIGPAAGAIVALPSRATTPANRTVGLGVFYTIYYLAMAVGPGIAGWAQTTWETPSAALVIGGALFLLGAPLLALFNRLCGLGLQSQ